MPLTFNTLLRTVGIDPAGVLLLRHSDPRVQRRVYDAAISGDVTFDDYQRRQSAPRVIASFSRANHLAGFVADHVGATVFAGVWNVLGKTDEPYADPFFPNDEPRLGASFRTSRLPILDHYRGRLVIDWGEGQRAWVQRAHLRSKPLVEIRKQVSEPSFPGYLQFHARLSEVERLPSKWIAALQATGGIYLLVHRERAHLYVGSATGADGFFGRWVHYQDGHGGNVAMEELEGRPEDYDVSILETAGSAVDEVEVLRREACWKEKLGSRRHGLNRN